MAYLNLDPAFFTHRKTVRLVARLGPGAEILPIRLWAYCAQHHPKDGSLIGYDKVELDALLGLKGAVDALQHVGFLDRTPDLAGWVCHDWLEHQGHLAAFKCRAERAAKARWDKARMLKDAPSNAPSIAPSNALSNTPYLTNMLNQNTLSDSVESDGEGEGEVEDQHGSKPREAMYSERFLAFWNFFPRRIGKGKAWATFKRLNAADQQAAVEQAEAYSQAYQLAPESRRQFFKHPATWLNSRSWEDDHAEWSLIIEGK